MHDPLDHPVYILGVPVHPFTVDTLHREIASTIRDGRRSFIANANVNALNIGCADPAYRNILRHADCVFCDGAGVMLAARLLGHRLPARITYADWLPQLAAFCAGAGFSLFFLGGRPGVAAESAARLTAAHPGLRVAGTHHGYFRKDPGHPENAAVLDTLNAASPDILVVSFGMPAQEEWLAANWQGLNARVGLTGGAAFDYVSGNLRRAPRWMTQHGFEWLGRLVIEPRRLWKRYLVGNPLFLYRVLRQRFGRGDCTR